MIEIGIAEAQTTLVALLELVEKGEEVLITRAGSPVARLMSTQHRQIELTEAQRVAAQAASERMRQRVSTLPKQSFDWGALKADLGRKY